MVVKIKNVKSLLQAPGILRLMRGARAREGFSLTGSPSHVTIWSTNPQTAPICRPAAACWPVGSLQKGSMSPFTFRMSGRS